MNDYPVVLVIVLLCFFPLFAMATSWLEAVTIAGILIILFIFINFPVLIIPAVLGFIILKYMEIIK